MVVFASMHGSKLVASLPELILADFDVDVSSVVEVGHSS